VGRVYSFSPRGPACQGSAPGPALAAETHGGSAHHAWRVGMGRVKLQKQSRTFVDISMPLGAKLYATKASDSLTLTLIVHRGSSSRRNPSRDGTCPPACVRVGG